MLNKIFKLNELQTSVKQEITAGITTFITMAYIIIVNPKILAVAGIPFSSAMTATILTAFFGTILMGLYAKRPFAIASYVGESAFITYTIVKILGYTWQEALGAVFIGGFIFFVLTLINVRTWLAHSIPESLRIAFTVGLGLFLTFIGLNAIGIVKLGIEGAPVQVGKLNDPTVILGALGFLLIGYLMIKKVKAAILVGILSITLLSFGFGLVEIPKTIVSMPPSILPTLGQLNIFGILKFEFIPVIFTLLIMIFSDTMGALIGVSYRTGMLNEKGMLPEIEKPMLCDSLATMFGALTGTSTAGTYIESATGIESGGKTGLTSVVTAFMFLIALFFAPLFIVIPDYAYGPALAIVGMMMLTTISQVQFDELTELIPVFCIIVLISFTYNIGVGMSAGFIIYPLLKLLSGKRHEVSMGLWILSIMAIAFFILYPY